MWKESDHERVLDHGLFLLNRIRCVNGYAMFNAKSDTSMGNSLGRPGDDVRDREAADPF